MSTAVPPFAMPSPYETESGTVLMLEPPSASAGELCAQLLDESYPKPFVIDDGKQRYLYFNVRLMQSAMSLRAPNALELRYTQKMMAFLLFRPHPKRIDLIGLGGGSLIKFCYHRLPGTRLTAIELDPDVIAWRNAFLLPPDDARLQVVHADGAEYLAQTAMGIDVLLVDAFDRNGFAPSLANRDFFANAFAKLAGNGVMVINLAGERDTYAGMIGEALAAFDDQVIVISVPEDGNHILFAFKERHFEPRWRWLHNFAKELRSRHGLDFPAFAHQLERSTRLGLARREGRRRR